MDGKVHFTARLEAAVAQACEAAPGSRVASQWGLPPETVRRMDQRVLRRWAAARLLKVQKATAERRRLLRTA